MRTSSGIFGGKFCPLHNGHVSAILKAASKVDTLFVILSHNDNEPFTMETRLNWLTQTLNAYNKNNIVIVPVFHKGWVQSDEEWVADAEEIRVAIQKLKKDPLTIDHRFEPDYVFVGSDDHPGKFQLAWPKSKYVVLDPDRNAVPISGRMIMSNPTEFRKFIPDIVYSYLVDERIIYSGPIFNLVTANGFDLIKMKHESVCILAYDIHTKDICLIEEFRPVINAYRLSLPAGKIEKTDLSPLHAAVREFKEETGYDLLLDSLKIVYEYNNASGYSNEKIYLVTGEFDSSKLDPQRLDDKEKITVKRLDQHSFVHLTGSSSASFIIARYYFKEHFKGGRWDYLNNYLTNTPI